MPDGQPAAKVHFVFNVLVETTRTSSYAGGTVKDKKTNKDKFLFPSANGQNVDPRIRPAYRPRDGWLILSIDYSSIELVSAGSRQLSLFGHSKIADLLTKGVDLHAYMAGQLAYNLNESFRAAYESGGSVYDQDRIYEFFYGAKSSDDPDVVNFYKHWRKFAKPVDLGFPGGLGAETFVSFAKGYGVQITSDDARKMRDIWIATFPEFQLGFDWINNQCQDPRWPVIGHKKNGKAIQGHAYSTPMGAYRSACAYTSAANGSMLQSPTAEAAKLAVFSAARACLDTGARTPLSGCFMLDFIHDEILFEIPEDGYEQERAEYASSLMVDAAKLIFPNVPVATEPALSRRWYKQADPVYDANGRLAVWEPSNEE